MSHIRPQIEQEIEQLLEQRASILTREPFTIADFGELDLLDRTLDARYRELDAALGVGGLLTPSARRLRSFAA